MEKDEEFLKRLLATFKIEAQEHLNAISSGLIELEKAGAEGQFEIVERVYREFHSLKGAARSVNHSDIVDICQSLEYIFAGLKRGEISVSPEMFDQLHQGVDLIVRLVSGDEASVLDKSEIRALLRKLEDILEDIREQAAPSPSPSPARGEGYNFSQPTSGEVLPTGEKVLPTGEEVFITSPPLRGGDEGEGEIRKETEPEKEPIHRSTSQPIPAISETVRISTAKLDALLLQAEEMLSVKLATGQRVAELNGIKKAIVLRKKETAKVRSQDSGVGSRKVEQKLGIQTLKSEADFIRTIETGIEAVLKTAEYDYRSFGTMVDNLLDNMKKSLMLPFSSLTDMFPKFVRDLSRDMGKKTELVISGGEIEMDRRIMEELKDPLIHLVRNCIDHGIEMPEERGRKNKPPQGTITISAASRDDKIEIAVSDDGAGIDMPKIRSSAVKQGVITQEEAKRLNEQDALSLIFRSGVTTSRIITDISGRGLGLAIVREKAEKLNGATVIDTQPDAGTTFRLVVPLTLATFRGVLVKVAERLFVLPSANVERVARVKKDEIKTVENRETLSFNGQALSFSRLGDVLEIKAAAGNRRSAPAKPDSFVYVIVVGSAEKRMAFQADEVLQEQEVLVKPLGRQLSRVRNIAGATVIGSGKVVPVLNISDLMKSAVKLAGIPVERAVEEIREKGRSVLVVEDSITARTLLRNILESAGYDVRTAVDGADAFTALKTQAFDIVVSDVDMPRMNGFDLTSKIRSDKKLFETPVVLVTALESREDRERGVDVGANAYIVKSSFDQSNLLEVVRRLV